MASMAGIGYDPSQLFVMEPGVQGSGTDDVAQALQALLSSNPAYMDTGADPSGRNTGGAQAVYAPDGGGNPQVVGYRWPTDPPGAQPHYFGSMAPPWYRNMGGTDQQWQAMPPDQQASLADHFNQSASTNPFQDLMSGITDPGFLMTVAPVLGGALASGLSGAAGGAGAAAGDSAWAAETAGQTYDLGAMAGGGAAGAGTAAGATGGLTAESTIPGAVTDALNAVTPLSQGLDASLGAQSAAGLGAADAATAGAATSAAGGLPQWLTQLLNPNPASLATTAGGQLINQVAGGGGGAAGTTGAAGAGGNTGLSSLLGLLGIGSGLSTMFGGNTAVDPARVNSLWQAGQNTYNTSLDPQNALYNQQFQQNVDQTRAGQSARGIAMSPLASGLEDQSNQNFNMGWQNNQLARQVQGTGAFAQAGNVAANAGIANNAQAFLQNQTGLNNLTTGANTLLGGGSGGGTSALGSWLTNLFGGGGGANTGATTSGVGGVDMTGFTNPNYDPNFMQIGDTFATSAY